MPRPAVRTLNSAAILFELVCLPAWRATAIAVVALALLFAFQRLVHQAVAQGEFRRQANALFEMAAWRCKSLRPDTLRDACLRELAPVPRDSEGLSRMQAATTAATLVTP